MLSLMALLTLGLSPYEVRIVTILQAHLKSPLHATGRPNNLARKKELAMFLSSGELVRLTTAVALGILGNNKNMADSTKAPVKNVFKVFPTEKDLTWSINIFRNPDMSLQHVAPPNPFHVVHRLGDKLRDKLQHVAVTCSLACSDWP